MICAISTAGVCLEEVNGLLCLIFVSLWVGVQVCISSFFLPGIFWVLDPSWMSFTIGFFFVVLREFSSLNRIPQCYEIIQDVFGSRSAVNEEASQCSLIGPELNL